MATESTKKPPLITTREAAHEVITAVRSEGKTIGLVPTMGALHAGHLSLVEAATAECDFTVVTVFVNPTQFGEGEDCDHYPRNLDRDLELLTEHAADLVFAPGTKEMYRAGHATRVVVGSVAKPLEGLCRPGHFEGVATIVLKLFNIIPADFAYFGEKDYQQCLVVQRMVEDLDLPIDIRICPIVRDEDGLALSSRNAYLTTDERRQALALSKSLHLAESLIDSGERDAQEIARKMTDLIQSAGDVQIDYVEVADPETLEPVTVVNKTVVALLAVRVGTARLIDNALLSAPG
ncbi:MAG: pantoate--beta-alanine ligase [Planctomycetota bacterium]|nr:pantoate--beta-alanine ligase [Planctomycetota bacterium]